MSSAGNSAWPTYGDREAYAIAGLAAAIVAGAQIAGQRHGAQDVRHTEVGGLRDDTAGNADQRATVLSFDSLLASTGGVVFQPALGKAADVWGYAASYGVGAVIQVLALPFLWRARREQAASDPIEP